MSELSEGSPASRGVVPEILREARVVPEQDDLRPKARRAGKPRGTSNSDARGSAETRRRRKQYLLDTFGDGQTAPCLLRVSPDCEGTVTFQTVTVDRHPVRGADGGTYRRGNIRPACSVCNTLDGARFGGRRSAAKRTARA